MTKKKKRLKLVYKRQTHRYEYSLCKGLVIFVKREAVRRLFKELYEDQRLQGFCPAVARWKARSMALSVSAWVEIGCEGDPDVFVGIERREHRE